jgi:transposase
MAKPGLFVSTLRKCERQRLRNHLQRTRDPHYSAHLVAVLLSEQRMPVSGIARLLGRHPTSIAQWLKDYQRFGLRGLQVGKSPGRPRKVDEEADACLAEALACNPRDLGYRFTRWSLPTLAEHLYRHVHVRVHPMSVSRALHRLRYAYKRPKHSLRHRQKRWDVARARHARNAALKKLAPDPTGTPFCSKTSVSSICIPA